MRLQLGDVVDRYRVGRCIGRGGQASVYVVAHRLLNTRHALKVLHSPTPKQRTRLITEGRVQALLDANLVVPVTDLFEVGATLGLLMPLVEGCSLADLIDEPLPPEAVVFVADAILRALAVAHSKGIVHRDLKPANVLVDEMGGVRVRVADFGVAAVFDDETPVVSEIVGSPAYMSPEQISGSNRVDARSDLWSLGVLLYEMLVGCRPFRALSVNALFDAIRAGKFAVERLPPMWRGFIHRLLATDASTRFGGAAEAREMLVQFAPTPCTAILGDRLALHRIPLQPVELTGASEPGSGPEASRLLGRQGTIDSVSALLDRGTALVTLVGPGGVGKTSVAKAVALRMELSGWPVFTCELESCRTVSHVAEVVGRTLGLALGNPDPVAAVGRILRSRPRSLYCLDNVEQVCGIQGLLDAWTRSSPNARFLVTSRGRTAARLEHILPIQPLSEDAAVALLERRLRASRPDCAFDAEVARDVVRALDGLPLTIELAAARATMMTLEQIRDRLNDPLRLLADQRRDGRQSALQDCIRWSWDLLDRRLRISVAQLCAFEGRFSVEDAEGVLHVDGGWVPDVLQALVDSSWLQRAQDGRLRMLLSIRAFVLEHGSQAWMAKGYVAHACWFARLGAPEEIEACLRGANIDASSRHVEARRQVRAALDRVDSIQPPVRAALARAFWMSCRHLGPFPVGVGWLEDTLQGAEEATERAASVVCLVEARRVTYSTQPDWGGLLAETSVEHAFFMARVVEERGLLASRLQHTQDAGSLLLSATEQYRRIGAEVRASEAFAASVGPRIASGLATADLRMLNARLTAMRGELESVGAWRGACSTLAAMAFLAQSELRLDDARGLLTEGLAFARKCGDLAAESHCLLFLLHHCLHASAEDMRPRLKRYADLAEVLGLEPLNLAMLEVLVAVRHDGIDVAITKMERAVAVGRNHPRLVLSWTVSWSFMLLEHDRLDEASHFAGLFADHAPGSPWCDHLEFVRAMIARRQGFSERADASVQALSERSLTPETESYVRGYLAQRRVEASDFDGALAVLPPLTSERLAPAALHAWAEIHRHRPQDVCRERLHSAIVRCAYEDVLYGPRSRESLSKVLNELRPPDATDPTSTLDY